MRYVFLGEGISHPHAIQWTGQSLDDAIKRQLIGITSKTIPQHPDPVYYLTGDLWKWVEATLGEKWDNHWDFARNMHMKVAELRFADKQMAMQCKLLFAGTPVLIP